MGFIFSCNTITEILLSLFNDALITAVVRYWPTRGWLWMVKWGGPRGTLS